MAVLCKHPKVRQLIADELLFYAKDSGLKGFEYIHGFHLEPNEWTPETALVSPKHFSPFRSLSVRLHQHSS